MSLTLSKGTRIGPGVQLNSGFIPTILNTGLALYLDAGNPVSYPESGTTWTDLVAANVFTLYNGPTYSNSNGGCLNFNSASEQYAQGASLPSSLTNWSVEAWHYYDGTIISNQSPCIITEVYAGNPINFTMGNTSDSSPNLQVGFFDGHWGSTPQGTVLTAGNWYHIVATWNGSTVKLYINGVLASSQVDGGTSSRGGQGIRLMRRWDAPQYWGGKLAVVRIYDNDVGLSGVTQNYNSEKSRFGL